MRQKPKPPSQNEINAALKALGADPSVVTESPRAQQFKAHRERVYEELLAFWRQHKRPPSRTEMSGRYRRTLPWLVENGLALKVNGKYIPIVCKTDIPIVRGK